MADNVLMNLPVAQFAERIASLFRQQNMKPTYIDFINDDKSAACCIGILALDAGYVLSKDNIIRPEDYLISKCNLNGSFVSGVSKGFNPFKIANLLRRPTPLFCQYGGIFEVSKFDYGWDCGRTTFDRLMELGYIMVR